MSALASRPSTRRVFTLRTLRTGRLDAPDQFIELCRSIANIMREVTDHLERLLRLPDFQKFADEILVFLQGLQQSDKLRPRVIEFLGRAFGLVLEPAPLR